MTDEHPSVAVPKGNETAGSADLAIDPSTSHASSPNRSSGVRVQQVRTAARDALEDKVKPRVDKVRRASTLVLDGAASDSGIRFLLVVAILFVLFLVLLFLSEWIT